MSLLNCPRCETAIGDEHLIGSNAYCPNCGWYGARNQRAVLRARHLRKFFSRAVMLVSVALLVGLSFDALHWGRYMGNHVLLRAKQMVGMADAEDWYNFGLICNSLERWKCSKEAFSQLLKVQPQNENALAGLAIAQTRLNEFPSAAANFERLNVKGRGTFDTMANYARAIEGLGRQDEAIAWYYRSLMLNPRMVDAADRLIDLLVAKKSYSEALSLIASLSRSSPEMNAILKGRRLAVSQLEQKDKGEPRHAIRLISLNDHHFLPIRLTGMNQPTMFMVDTGATELILSREFLNENKLKGYTVQGHGLATLADGHMVPADRVLFRQLEVGPWTLRDVSAVVCESCAPLAGQSLLKRFQISMKSVGGVEYLTLKR